MGDKEVKNANTLLPQTKDLTKEQIKENLRRVIAETHKHHAGKKEHYRINVIAGGKMSEFDRSELEGMGCTVRDMPAGALKAPTKKDKK